VGLNLSVNNGQSLDGVAQTLDSWTSTFFGLFHTGMTVVLSMSGLISQRTVRAGRVTSFILPADADLGKVDARNAGRRGDWRSMVEQLAASGGDFLANSCDKNRNFTPPGDVGTSFLGVLGGAVSVGDGSASSGVFDECSGVTGDVKLCQLRDRMARCLARCWSW